MSSPDITMLASICRVLGISCDYLLGNVIHKITEDGNEKVQGEIWTHLRDGLEPLELVIGQEVVSVFENREFFGKVVSLRLELSKQGILMPLVHIQDMSCLRPREFMILSYQNILYQEELGSIGSGTLDYLFEKLQETVHNQYAEIINVDIMKSLVDNLRIKYPALIEGVVPDTISYGLLTEVSKQFLKRGNSLIYLPKIIETMDLEMRKNADMTVKELCDSVNTTIEREDNIWCVLAKRNKGQE